MFTALMRKILAAVMVISLFFAVLPKGAIAAMIGTQGLFSTVQREACLARIDKVIVEQRVHDQLVECGVDPSEVRGRIASLTDAELRLIDQKINSLPAGGNALAVVGVVFIVLLILEIVGVTDIFKKV